jgi:hypothetical protein
MGTSFVVVKSVEKFVKNLSLSGEMSPREGFCSFVT